MIKQRHTFPTFVLFAAAFLSAAGVAADREERLVRLIWFPRFSPDGQWLITAHGSWEQTEGGEVRVWDVDTGKAKFVIPNNRGVRTVGWSPKGEFFASGDYGGTVHFFDTQSGKPSGELKFPDSVEVLQISPDAMRLITAHGDGSVVVSALPSKKEVHSWRRVHSGGIWGMRLSANGKALATAGKDGFVRVFDMEGLVLLHELKHPTEANGVAFTGDGKTLLTGCADSMIRFFDVASGRLLHSLAAHSAGSVTDMQFSPNGQVLATAGIDKTVRLWDVSDLAKPTLKATLEGHASFVFGVAISAKGKWLASAGWDDQIQVWDLSMQKQEWSWHR